MELVLKAASQINNNFSVIVNKVTKNIWDRLEFSGEENKKMGAFINSGLPGTGKIFYNLVDKKLEDEANKVIFNERLQQFTQTQAPKVRIFSTEVARIKCDDFQRIAEDLSKQAAELQQNKSLLKEKIQKENLKFVEVNTKRARNSFEWTWWDTAIVAGSGGSTMITGGLVLIPGGLVLLRKKLFD